MELITEYVEQGTKQAKVVDIRPGTMNDDQTLYRDHRGKLHRFVENAEQGCSICSLGLGSCNGAICDSGLSYGGRDDGKSGHFRRANEDVIVYVEQHDEKVHQHLKEAITKCSSLSGCEHCGYCRDHTCNIRILLQTFEGDEAWK